MGPELRRGFAMESGVGASAGILVGAGAAEL